ncbi:MAG: extracellular solute-binding protein [Clostridiales bacterium]
MLNKTCVFVIVSVILFFVGCDNKNLEINNKKKVDVKKIELWHYNKEEADFLKKNFEKKFDNYNVELNIIQNTDKVYQTKVQQLISSGSKDVPDVIAIEMSYLKKFVNIKNGLEDLNKEPYNSEKFISDMYNYTIELGKDSNGYLRAVTPKSLAITLGYRKNLTDKYLETKKEEDIDEMMSSFENIIETGNKLSDDVILFSNPKDLYLLYSGGRENPWVKDNKLIVDSKMVELVKLVKKLKENNLITNTYNWEQSFENEKCMFFALPVDRIKFLSDEENIKDNEDWGITQSIYPYSINGNWFGILKNSKNKENAWKFIDYVSSDNKLMESSSKKFNEMGNSKKKGIEFTNNENLVNKTFNKNIYSLWDEESKNINPELYSLNDELISLEFNNILIDFVGADSILKTENDVIEQFKINISNMFEDIIVE